jgi:hypothetical protein
MESNSVVPSAQVLNNIMSGLRIRYAALNNDGHLLGKNSTTLRGSFAAEVMCPS